MNENNAQTQKASKSENKGSSWTTINTNKESRDEALAGLPVLPDRVSDMATLGRLVAELRSAQK